jgi:hypothetical protein
MTARRKLFVLRLTLRNSGFEEIAFTLPYGWFMAKRQKEFLDLEASLILEDAQKSKCSHNAYPTGGHGKHL